MAGILERPMGKAGRPKRSERDDVTVKIDRGIVSKAKMIASARNVPLAEYLSELLRPPVARDFAKEMRRIESEEKGSEPGEK
jgi:hypothetical protein